MLILLGEKVVQHVFVSYAFLYDAGDIRSSPFSTILRVDGDVFEDAWSRFRTSSGLSFTDCSSFTLMEDIGISHAFTFDSHFRGAGFQTLP